jgi:4-amino-4-deoxy-L-arabinose transferase-like glycosyltransferase
MKARWIAAALVVLCAAWVQFTTARETHVPVPGGPDARAYVSYAYNLRQFGVYSRERTWESAIPARPHPDAISTPGYPLFLVPFLNDRPDLEFMARVVWVQALLGTLTALIAFMLGVRVGGTGLGLSTGLLTALTPHLATISTYVLTESLFAFLLGASLLALVWAARTRRPAHWALLGAVFALCCLVRPTLQALVPLGIGAAVLAPGRVSRLRSPAWLAVAVWVALMLPWLAYKHSIPPSPDQPDLLRATLYHGSFPDFSYGDQPPGHGMPYRHDPHADESMGSTSGLFHQVGRRMAAEPLRYVRWYLIGKPTSFLAWDNTIGGEGDAYLYRVDASPWFNRPTFAAIHAAMRGLHAPLMLTGLLGALIGLAWPTWFRAPVDPIAIRLLAGVAMAAVVFHVIGAPYPRYGIPFWPLLYALGISSMITAWTKVSAHRRASALTHPARS